MTEKKIYLSEICFYLMLLCFMGTKAVGLGEGQWPFKLAILVGTGCFLAKTLLTRFTLAEWIINILLIVLGLVVYFRNAHLEVLMAAFFIIGMKNIPLERAMKIALYIWLPLFTLTIIRALLGIEPGFSGPQMKHGLDNGVVRYSLGYTHPNVLHMTFLLVTLLVLYVVRVKGKKLLLLSLVLFLGNLYIFLYSLSFTGFITVTFAIAINLLYTYRINISKAEMMLYAIICFGCFILPTAGWYFLPEYLGNIINKLINGRLYLAREAFEAVPITFFGSNVPLPVFSLDSSYAYMLYYHGLIPLILFIVGFILTAVWAFRKKNIGGLIMLLVVAVSGITEQYLGNLSFKNISLLPMGYVLYNETMSAIMGLHRTTFEKERYKLDREFKTDGPAELADHIKSKVKRIFSNEGCRLSCLIAIVFLIIGNIIFGIAYVEPTKVYQVVPESWDDDNKIVYNTDEDSWLKSSEILIIGELEEGCYVAQLSWIDTDYETARDRISVSLWCFILGLVVAGLINISKTDSQSTTRMPKHFCAQTKTNDEALEIGRKRKK